MHNPMSVYVLFRFSNKTGKIDTTMTAMGSALLRLWAMQNTNSRKSCIIVERDTGNVVFAARGNAKTGVPQLSDKHGEPICHCSDMGISSEMLAEIRDDRFDN